MINVRVAVGLILAAMLTIGWLALGSLMAPRDTSAWAATPAPSGGTRVTFTIVSGVHPSATPTPTPTRTHGSGGLPVTGNGPALMWTVIGGTALIAAGGALIVIARR